MPLRFQQRHGRASIGKKLCRRDDFDGNGNACDLCLGDDTTGDLDGDGLCSNVDCNDIDSSKFCQVFRDGFESGDTQSWSTTITPSLF